MNKFIKVLLVLIILSPFYTFADDESTAKKLDKSIDKIWTEKVFLKKYNVQKRGYEQIERLLENAIENGFSHQYYRSKYELELSILRLKWQQDKLIEQGNKKGKPSHKTTKSKAFRQLGFKEKALSQLNYRNYKNLGNEVRTGLLKVSNDKYAIRSKSFLRHLELRMHAVNTFNNLCTTRLYAMESLANFQEKGPMVGYDKSFFGVLKQFYKYMHQFTAAKCDKGRRETLDFEVQAIAFDFEQQYGTEFLEVLMASPSYRAYYYQKAKAHYEKEGYPNEQVKTVISSRLNSWKKEVGWPLSYIYLYGD